MDSGRVSSSCSTSDTRRFTLVTNPVISHEWGKDRIVITTNGTYPGSFEYSVTHNVRSHDMIFNPISPLVVYGHGQSRICGGAMGINRKLRDRKRPCLEVWFAHAQYRPFERYWRQTDVTGRGPDRKYVLRIPGFPPRFFLSSSTKCWLRVFSKTSASYI